MSAFEGRNPYEDYVIINEELKNFNKKLLDKPQIVIANKMDLPNAKENLEAFKKKVNVPIYPISAINNEGLDEVLLVLADMLEKLEKQPLYEPEKFASHVVYQYQEEEPFKIYKDNNVWVIKGEQVEKLVKMTRFNSDEAVLRFTNKLRKLGIDDKLRELGAEEGDTVRILDFEFEYRP